MIRRGLLAMLLVLHGLLHASIGVWATADHSLVAVNTLWSLAIVGYLAAGFALLRVPVLRRHWKPILVTATVASLLLQVLYGGTVGLFGVPVGLALVFIAFDVMQRAVDADLEKAEVVHARGLPHPMAHRLGWLLAAAVLFYAAVVVVLRPVYLHWGTTAAERLAVLPGDETIVVARYRVDHGITIRAPSDSVWPWLAQLGQDRGGFYSYSSLERMFGDRRKVTGLVPGHALILENRGAFVLQPIDSATTRFFVRTRGEGKPTFAALLLGPLNVFVFEPAHFVMQRGMMRGIRDRAEGRIRGT